MAGEFLSHWQALFARALAILEAPAGAARADDWSLGGGTALMIKFRHRVNTNIGICLVDPQMLRDLSPRLNPAAADLTWGYVEHARFMRLYLPEGEIDFTASASLTPNPATVTRILGREVRIETPAEIVAKMIWHRAASLAARDVFDLACVVEREPAALLRIPEILAARRMVLLQHLEQQEQLLREDFEALDVLDYRPEFDDCLAVIARALAEIAPRTPHRVEQTLARYDLPPGLIQAQARRGTAAGRSLYVSRSSARFRGSDNSPATWDVIPNSRQGPSAYFPP
ncbi:MAG: nucleotidyl transferase AbiEii/AbiGii toxin family protein [Betaproteobacteria bacterium]|nr:nucleotidyl transferase AbiEii/AbiGii toxin family protein [Betaproteobacteria bacterium]